MAKLIMNDNNFDDIIADPKNIILVYFSAIWCAPCRYQGPVVDRIAREFENKGLVVGKIDVDQNPLVPQRFQILSIPTILFFKHGKLVKQLVGFHDIDLLKAEMKKIN